MYYGFPYRSELVKKNLVLDQSRSVLEVGVGTGHTAAYLSGFFRRIVGIDVARDSIDFLKSNLQRSNVSFETLDFCTKELPEMYVHEFDIAYSVDALEHIPDPEQFFNNLSICLKKNGVALVGFPNESEGNHHGITWFDSVDDLKKIIPTNLALIEFVEVGETIYFGLIKRYLWKPVMALSSRFLYRKEKPQTFEKTYTHSLNKGRPFLARLLAIYPMFLMWVSRAGVMFTYKDVGDEGINNKYLLIKVRKLE